MAWSKGVPSPAGRHTEHQPRREPHQQKPWRLSSISFGLQSPWPQFGYGDSAGLCRGKIRSTPREWKRLPWFAFLALLFPVISLTDDLHPETVVVDAASGKRNACLIAVSAPHVGACNPRFEGALDIRDHPRPSASVGSAVEEILLLAKFNDPVSSASSSPGRSPPSLL